MTRLDQFAHAVAVAEGFFKAGALPQRMNNPGDLTDYHTGKLKQYETIEEGWIDLQKFLGRIQQGRSKIYSLDMTIAQMAKVYTGEVAFMNWARIISIELGISPDSKLREILAA